MEKKRTFYTHVCDKQNNIPEMAARFFTKANFHEIQAYRLSNNYYYVHEKIFSFLNLET